MPCLVRLILNKQVEGTFLRPNFVSPTGNKMTSREATADLDFLLSMNTKLRLLDVEGLDLPEEPPVIPREPTNYDFAVEIK